MGEYTERTGKREDMGEYTEKICEEKKAGEEVSQKECQKEPGCVRYKATPRGEGEKRQLRNRLSRMAGQLNGIGKMLDEDRYCGDILVQVAAVESALQSFAYMVLQEHMETCVVEEIQKGNKEVVEEVVELVKRLK